MSDGEMQIEGYCSNGRAHVDYYDWYCTDSGRQLTFRDFDTICQRTYGNTGAFAVQNGRGSQPSYRWRCYAFAPQGSQPPSNPNPGQGGSGDRTCPNSPPSRMRIGDVGYVIASEGPSNLNKHPRRSGRDNLVVDIIQPDEQFTVLNGPTCGDGLTWWQVRYQKNGFVGWIAEGQGNVYWISRR